jgi:hypothetical protein
MGYCIDQQETKFEIKAANVKKALAAIKKLAGKETIKDAGGPHFSWVDHNFAKCKTFKEIMDAWRWEVCLDDKKNVIELYFDGEKLGDDFILFSAIAPFVTKGSYIIMRGEDGCVWRWFFDGKRCLEQSGTVTFE